MEGWRGGQQGTPSKTPAQCDDLPPPPDISSGDFENRLLRARSEPLSILRRRLIGEQFVSADVHNKQTGNTYHVTSESCDCEDFKKRGQPCKHMIYLALKTGDFLRYEKPLPVPPPKYRVHESIPLSRHRQGIWHQRKDGPPHQPQKGDCGQHPFSGGRAGRCRGYGRFASVPNPWSRQRPNWMSWRDNF